jgi:hypothetical protein
MTQIAQPDFSDSEYFRPRRPSLLPRAVRRYQVLELTVIIGGILLLWGATSLGRVHAALQAPLEWLALL